MYEAQFISRIWAQLKPRHARGIWEKVDEMTSYYILLALKHLSEEVGHGEQKLHDNVTHPSACRFWAMCGGTLKLARRLRELNRVTIRRRISFSAEVHGMGAWDLVRPTVLKIAIIYQHFFILHPERPAGREPTLHAGKYPWTQCFKGPHVGRSATARGTNV